MEKELVARLAKRYGNERSFKDEILHRREHSLELQLPFIAHRYRNQRLPAIVPILVGSFNEFFDSGKTPLEHAEVGDFVDALAEVIGELKQANRKVLFYAGVDLSHMGQFFGDEEKISDEHLSMIEQRDLELLDCVMQADEEKLFAHIAEDSDRRRGCGYPSM